jgi:hypothetical protein
VQVFLSWSGERSKELALALSEWLPQVIQAAEPFISTTIEKGRRWSSEIAERLNSAPIGIVCVTRDNLRSPWLLFEAGAMSKPKGGYVCTFLLDVEPTDVEAPLGDFQHTRAEKVDVLRLVQTINGALGVRGEKPLSETVLERVFERNWPELELSLEEMRQSAPARLDRARSDREILDEILSLVRRTTVGPEMWREADFIARLGDMPPGAEIPRPRPNVAFVYTIRIAGGDDQQRSDLIAAIDRLDGLVTSRVTITASGFDIECVFLRAAETDIANMLKALKVNGQVAVARSVAFQQEESRSLDQAPEEKRLPPMARAKKQRRG